MASVVSDALLPCGAVDGRDTSPHGPVWAWARRAGPGRPSRTDALLL